MLSSKPKYSVIIPTHNGLHLLSETLKILRLINRIDIEIVIFNNSDQQSYSNFHLPNDSRVRYLTSCSVLPHSSSLNAALACGRGDWITYMGDDDFMLPNIFEIFDDLISKFPESDFIVGSNLRFEWPSYSDRTSLSLPIYSKYTYALLPCAQYLSDFMNSLTVPSGGQCLFSSPLLGAISSRLGYLCPEDPVVEFYLVRAAAYMSDYCLFTNQPFYINGRANKSIGTKLISPSSFDWSFESPNGYFLSAPYDSFNYATISFGGLNLLANDLGFTVSNQFRWHVVLLRYCFSRARGSLLVGRASQLKLISQAFTRKPLLTILSIPFIFVYWVRCRFFGVITKLDKLTFLPTRVVTINTSLVQYLQNHTCY